MPIISIIMPVYQMEECLDRSISSILAQTFTDFELILVNDGSTDKSGLICEKYAASDTRVRVIHQENQGQGIARNTGIQEAIGKFIGFIDADDWISSDMYEHLHKICTDYDCEIAEVSVKVTKTDSIPNRLNKPNIQIFDKGNILENYLYEGLKNNTKYSVCNKIYLKSLFDEIKFNKINYSEDFLINFKIMSLVKRMVSSSLECYYYYQREGSSIHQGLNKKNFKNFDNMHEVVELSAEMNKSKLVDLAQLTHNRLYFSLLLKAMVYGQDETVSEKDILNLHRNLRRCYSKLIKSPMPLNRKIIMTVLVVNKSLVQLMIKLALVILNKK